MKTLKQFINERKSDREPASAREAYDYMMEEGYTVYVDGVEVMEMEQLPNGYTYRVKLKNGKVRKDVDETEAVEMVAPNF